jgi:hypothetical protein
VPIPDPRAERERRHFTYTPSDSDDPAKMQKITPSREVLCTDAEAQKYEKMVKQLTTRHK